MENINLFNYSEINKLENELKLARQEIKSLEIRNENLWKELFELKAKEHQKKHRKFTATEIEMIKMYSLQKDQDGKFPSIRTLAKEFNCSVGLIHSIISPLKANNSDKTPKSTKI